MSDTPPDAADARRARLAHGSAMPPPERIQVQAGPLSLVIEAGDVRHVHVGGREVVRRIYAAVRDHEWRTIPARLENVVLERGADAFTCRYRAVHREHAVAFSWTGTIEGRADGTLTFAFDGVADATFERNRIGLCLLHPLPLLSGAPVRVTTVDGETRSLAFPDLVTVEQPIAGFHDIASIACEIGPDLWLEAAVEGDVFETEDQRNWIDASIKTYSTPSRLPKPVRVAAGTRIAQRITLRLRTAAGAPARVAASPYTIDREAGEVRFGDGERGRVPAIGIRHGSIVRHVRPAHVRIDLDLAAPDVSTRLAEAAAAQRETGGPPIELALRVPAGAAAATEALAALAPAGLTLARVLAFTIGHDTTQPATLDAVRAWLARHPAHAATPIATGTASDLARIHLAPAPLVQADAVTWAMHPQAHATDLTTIAETPDGARDQARTARQRWPDRPLALTASFGRQGQADPRSASLFAAGWTLALIGALGEGGADSVTIVDPWPEADAAALPVVAVLAALASWRGATLRPVATTIDTVRAVRIDAGDRDVLVVANLGLRPCALALPPGGPWTARFLDADTAAQTVDAGGLGDAGPASSVTGRLALGPCAIVRLERPRG